MILLVYKVLFSFIHHNKNLLCFVYFIISITHIAFSTPTLTKSNNNAAIEVVNHYMNREIK